MDQSNLIEKLIELNDEIQKARLAGKIPTLDALLMSLDDLCHKLIGEDE